MQQLATLQHRSARLLAAILAAGMSLACATTVTAGPQATPAPVASATSLADAKTSGGRQVAQDFSLEDLDGRDLRLSSFAGKVVLIDFWATWCTPCTAEIPLLQNLYDKYKSQGFVVIGISMDGPETEAQVLPFVQRNGLTFPVAVDEETRVINVYNPARAAPLSILIDRSGRIFRTREGYDIGDEKLIEKDVKSLLKP